MVRAGFLLTLYKNEGFKSPNHQSSDERDRNGLCGEMCWSRALNSLVPLVTSLPGVSFSLPIRRFVLGLNLAMIERYSPGSVATSLITLRPPDFSMVCRVRPWKKV